MPIQIEKVIIEILDVNKKNVKINYKDVSFVIEIIAMKEQLIKKKSAIETLHSIQKQAEKRKEEMIKNSIDITRFISEN